MKDQRSTSDNKKEPPRPKSIPVDFIWDPEIEAWFAPGEPSTYNAKFDSLAPDNLSEEKCSGGVITVDQLRIAGALDVPAWMRKSLGGEERDLFSDVSEEGESGRSSL